MHLNPDTQLTDFLGKNHFFCDEHCRSRPSDYKVAVTICVIYQLKMVDFVSSYSLRLHKTVLKTFKIISIDIRGVNEVQRDRKDCLSSHYEAHYNSEELWRFRRNEGKKDDLFNKQRQSQGGRRLESRKHRQSRGAVLSAPASPLPPSPLLSLSLPLWCLSPNSLTVLSIHVHFSHTHFCNATLFKNFSLSTTHIKQNCQ